MIKPRKSAKATEVKDLELERRIEAFASKADLVPGEQPENNKVLDKDAQRDFKSIRVSFNEYEYGVLDQLSKKLNRSKLNLIRHAILMLAESEDAK
ncbi:hypothetical protein EB516_11720 [Escherichia coli]|uniref:hypothetical protein n=1 Tax=Escherichia coli TaxID=562 RepID=UPI000FAF44A0|nr:hypothetical protein [Escherichia coli]EEH6229456.1 hypothetical protein [Salmonella enterica subsp. enterica]EKP5352671.1 hypothetical protein [Salmonella enterica]EFB9778181.1 hypothetical protein [Escherichia coli]EIA1615164.1 hypothetical protein [Escherichia coli]MDM1591738.1 hypothetical protein [Escherichia coli]